MDGMKSPIKIIHFAIIIDDDGVSILTIEAYQNHNFDM